MTADEELALPEFGPSPDQHAVPLVCPSCGSEYLHHGVVMIYDRGQDQTETTVTESAPDFFARIILATAESGNPSARADGLTVRMWCEVCPGELELCLAHHRGQTMVRWRRPTNGTMEGEGESDER
jgi:hypothetical protein